LESATISDSSLNDLGTPIEVATALREPSSIVTSRTPLNLISIFKVTEVFWVPAARRITRLYTMRMHSIPIRCKPYRSHSVMFMHDPHVPSQFLPQFIMRILSVLEQKKSLRPSGRPCFVGVYDARYCPGSIRSWEFQEGVQTASSQSIDSHVLFLNLLWSRLAPNPNCIAFALCCYLNVRVYGCFDIPMLSLNYLHCSIWDKRSVKNLYRSTTSCVTQPWRMVT